MKLSGFEPDDELADPILDPALPIIDAHHHLWPSGAHIPYDLADFGEDLASGHNIVGTVFVECMTGYRQDGEAALRPVGETEFAVGEAGGVHGVAAGIVGYADLTDPRVAARTLDGHIAAGQGRFSGVRHNVVWHEREELIGARRRPPGLLLEPAFRESLAEVARRGLTYDVWLFHGQLAELAATADALPDLIIIARTDAVTVDEGCRRTQAYAQAGADMVLTISRCAQSYEDLVRIREAAGVPLLHMLTGWSEKLTPDQLDGVVGVGCFGMPTLFTVAQSLRTNLAALRRTHSSSALPLPMTTFADFKEFIGFPEVEKLQHRFIPMPPR